MLTSKRIAISLILAGLGGSIASVLWLSTRKLVPVDVPVSLARGRLSPVNFSINLESDYYIEIEVEQTPTLNNLECLMSGCDETPSMLKVEWKLSQGGGIELAGSSDNIAGNSGVIGVQGRKVGLFNSSGGDYRLDVGILSETAVLNAGHPRLKVEAEGKGYNRLSRLRESLAVLCTVLIVLGSALLLVSHATTIANTEVHGIRRRIPTFGRGFPPLAPFSRLPPFGLLGVLTLPVAVTLTFLPHYPASKGIWVFTSGRSVTPDPPLVLKIDKTQRWFFGRKAGFSEGLSWPA